MCYCCMTRLFYESAVKTCHQESLLVHLLWSGPNTMLLLLLLFFGAVCFHTALFASEPETRVLRSSIHCFVHSTIPEFIWNRTETTSSAGSRCGCLVLTRVWLLYFHLPKRSAPKWETNLSSIQSNQTRQVWMHPYIEKTKTEVIFTFNISL